jgi:hypothetical protein
MCSHIPNRGEQMVKYYGYYSNVSRGKRQKEGLDDAVPCILEPQGDEKVFRRNWARLIQKIYEVDPLVCPKCQGVMRVISSIEDPSVIRDILNHLGLWLIRARPPPKICGKITLTPKILPLILPTQKRKFLSIQFNQSIQSILTPKILPLILPTQKRKFLSININ